MCNVCIFRNVKEVLVRDVNTPPHTPNPPWWSYDSMRNVCIFRNVKEVFVKNVNTPPHPPWWSYDSMCNMLKTQKNQILYPHFRKPHFWNLQPFQGIVNGTSQNWQPFQGRRISRMPKTTTVKHHGPDNQGLFPCLPAFCKKAASSNKHHNPWICWRCHAKKIWPHRCLKTVQNSSVQGFWHMMHGFTVRLADANSVEEHLCLRSPKHGHQTGDQNPWTKWPGGPSDVMPVTGKARKLSETEKHHHEDTWLWLKNDSPLRIQNDTYYDICLINMS